MNKKGIIGIALFIIIGLLTFTFANPNDKIDDKDNNKGKENKKQEVINKENDLITDDLVINPVQPYTEPQNNNTVILTPVITTNPVPAVTNDPEKLRLAQEAVSKVEKTLLMDDSQYAHNLVNELNDSQDKNELNDRLAVVDQKIEFLAHLSELINQAKSTLNQNDLAKYVSITIDNLSSALTNGEAVFIDGSNCTIKQIKMAINFFTLKL